MSEPVEVVRELYAAVAAGDRGAIAARLAPNVRWEGRARGPRWRRRRPSCAGSHDATCSMMLIGRKLPTVQPRAFQAAATGCSWGCGRTRWRVARLAGGR